MIPSSTLFRNNRTAILSASVAIVSTIGLRYFIVSLSRTKLEPTGKTSFYDITATASDGTQISMNDFRGKVMYATNVASK
jgi:hypothetical protein